MHSALRLGSVEYSGYLDLASGVCPSTRLRVAPGFGVRTRDTLLRIELPCLRTSTGIGFRLATRLRHAGLEGYCPAPTYVIDGEERLLAALEMTARRIAEKRRKVWLRQLQRCNRM